MWVKSRMWKLEIYVFFSFLDALVTTSSPTVCLLKIQLSKFKYDNSPFDRGQTVDILIKTKIL